MCGRYGFYRADEFAERFGTKKSDFDVPDNFNAAPGQMLPVIRETEQGRVLEGMKWGLVPVWAKDVNIGYKMINARSETIFEKPAWRGPVKRHRCLVPARGFYEWQKLEKNGKPTKQPYFIKPKDQDLFAFAGLYSTWHDSNGNELWTFTIVTTSANKEMAPIHDREPVILQPEDESLWLDPSVSDRLALEAVLRQYPDGKLEMVAVSSDVNVVKNNDDHLILPINSK